MIDLKAEIPRYLIHFDKIETSFKEPLLLPRTIPEHIIGQILAAAYQNIKSAHTECEQRITLRNAVIIELLFATGARISEICSLKTADVDLTAKTVRIFGKGSNKCTANRTKWH